MPANWPVTQLAVVQQESYASHIITPTSTGGEPQEDEQRLIITHCADADETAIAASKEHAIIDFFFCNLLSLNIRTKNTTHGVHECLR